MWRPNKRDFRPDWTTFFDCWSNSNIVITQVRNSAQRDTDLSETIKIFHIKAGPSIHSSKHPGQHAPQIHLALATPKSSQDPCISVPASQTSTLPLPSGWARLTSPRTVGGYGILPQQKSEQISCRTTAKPTHRRKMLVLPSHCRPIEPCGSALWQEGCPWAGWLAHHALVFRVSSLRQALFPSYPSWSVSLGLSSCCLWAMGDMAFAWPLRTCYRVGHLLLTGQKTHWYPLDNMNYHGQLLSITQNFSECKNWNIGIGA